MRTGKQSMTNDAKQVRGMFFSLCLKFLNTELLKVSDETEEAKQNWRFDSFFTKSSSNIQAHVHFYRVFPINCYFRSFCQKVLTTLLLNT
jgi:hypothetical protein